MEKLHHIDEADVHRPHDLILSVEDDVVEVALVDAGSDRTTQELPEDVSNLVNQSDLSPTQQEELFTLFLKWKDVVTQ